MIQRAKLNRGQGEQVLYKRKKKLLWIKKENNREQHEQKVYTWEKLLWIERTRLTENQVRKNSCKGQKRAPCILAPPRNLAISS